MEKEIDVVIKKINEAFKNVSYPGDDLILSKTGSQESIDEVEYFIGKRRKDLNEEQLNINHSALSFFSPEAYQYYLPEFMKFSIKYRDTDKIAVDAVVFSLTIPESSDELYDYSFNMVKSFTGEQKQVVKEFLRCKIDLLPEDWDIEKIKLEKALISYWDTSYKRTVEEDNSEEAKVRRAKAEEIMKSFQDDE